MVAELVAETPRKFQYQQSPSQSISTSPIKSMPEIDSRHFFADPTSPQPQNGPSSPNGLQFGKFVSDLGLEGMSRLVDVDPIFDSGGNLTDFVINMIAKNTANTVTANTVTTNTFPTNNTTTKDCAIVAPMLVSEKSVYDTLIDKSCSASDWGAALQKYARSDFEVLEWSRFLQGLAPPPENHDIKPIASPLPPFFEGEHVFDKEDDEFDRISISSNIEDEIFVAVEEQQIAAEEKIEEDQVMEKEMMEEVEEEAEKEVEKEVEEEVKKEVEEEEVEEEDEDEDEDEARCYQILINLDSANNVWINALHQYSPDEEEMDAWMKFRFQAGPKPQMHND